MKTAAGLHFLDLKIFISMIYRFPWINVCKKPPDPHFFFPIFHFTKKNPPKLLETVGSLSLLGRHCCLALPSFFRGWSRSTLWNLVAGWMAGWQGWLKTGMISTLKKRGKDEGVSDL